MDQAESLRNIVRQKIQHIETNARVITITSGKGGVGKSNVAVNLAVQLQKLGKRVIIFDADFGLANVEVMFGTVPKYNLSDLIYHKKRIREIITKGPMDIGFISGGSGIASLSSITKDQIAYLIYNLKELDDITDFIIIDTGAGIADSVLEFVITSPEILLVVTPDPSSMTDAYSLLKALHKNPNFRKEDTVIRLVANKVFSVDDGHAVYHRLGNIVSKFLNGELHFLGMVPNDLAVDKAIRQQMPVSLVSPQAKASKAYMQIAEKLVGSKQEREIEKRGIIQIISHIIGKK